MLNKTIFTLYTSVGNQDLLNNMFTSTTNIHEITRYIKEIFIYFNITNLTIVPKIHMLNNIFIHININGIYITIINNKFDFAKEKIKEYIKSNYL